jgi:hypothetical protein
MWQDPGFFDGTNGSAYSVFYDQTIELENITKHSRLDLQPTPEMLIEFKNLGLVFITENNDGIITVYSIGVMPLKSYTIQATIIETECNEGAPVVGTPIVCGGGYTQAEIDAKFALIQSEIDGIEEELRMINEGGVE